MIRRGPALLLATLAGAAAFGAPRSMPSLAKINALFDQTRNLEARKNFAPAIPLYAAVLAECGDPVPRHLWHVAAKAYAKTGDAKLALGDLAGAQAAYREVPARFGSTAETVVRQHVLHAQVLLARVAELTQMMAGPPPGPDGRAPVGGTTGGPAVTASLTGSGTGPVVETGHEPLVLLTERRTGGTGAGGRGFEVQTFAGDGKGLEQAAERKADADGKKVLETGRDMALVSKVILPGSCWDYIDAVFTRAGFPERRRKVVAKGPKAGPYLDTGVIRPGDWLYFRNHSFGNSEHSAVFVEWVNAPSRVALMLSYPGQGRQEPARYRPYELTSVYSVTRPASL